MAPDINKGLYILFSECNTIESCQRLETCNIRELKTMEVLQEIVRNCRHAMPLVEDKGHASGDNYRM